MDHKKDNHEVGENTLKNKDIINVLFKDDPQFEFIYKKTERIISAVYLVSNLLDPAEPLKWELRKKSLELLPSVIGLRYLSGSSFKEKLEDSKTRFLELTSLFQVGVFAGYVSEMNFGIIKREIEQLSVLLNERFDAKDKGGTLSLSQDFFKVEASPLPLLSHGSSRTPSYKGHTNVLYKPHDTHAQLAVQGDIKDMSAARDERRTKILNMLKKKPNLTIKDFSEIITDCSEKTIQRILLGMVAEGVLKKDGERRWSTYSLAGK